MINVENLKPFPKFCYTIGMIPTSYKESLTYEEQLMWFCDFLQNTVIPTLNNNGLAVEELQNLYVQLKNYVDNYFTNLDVQEEINNKLDEMAQNGELANLINEFLKFYSIMTFNNINDMKNSTNLINGSKIKTLGFYDINDGGGALYYVTNENLEDNNMNIFSLKNNLFAVLIINNQLNIKQLGAKANDNKFDNHNIIMKALNLSNEILIPTGKFYTSALSLENLTNKHIMGNLSVASWNINSELCFLSSGIGIQCSDNNNETPSWSARSIIIEGLQINGNNILNTAINCNYDVTLKNLWITNCLNDGIILEGLSYPVTLDNVTVRNCNGNGCYIKSPLTTCYSFNNCEFSANNKSGLLVEGGNTASFINVKCQSNLENGITIFKPTSGYNNPIYCDKLVFINCYCENNTNYPFYANVEDGENNTSFTNKIQNLTLINCSFNFPHTGSKAELNACSTPVILNTNILNNSYYQNVSDLKFANSYETLALINNKYSETILQPLDTSSHVLPVKYSNGSIGRIGQYKNIFVGTINDTELKNSASIQYMKQGFFAKINSILLGLNVRLANNISQGSLTINIKWGYATYNSNDTNNLYSVTLDSSHNILSLTDLFKIIPANAIVGVFIEKSDDFQLQNSNFNGISVELITAE